MVMYISSVDAILGTWVLANCRGLVESPGFARLSFEAHPTISAQLQVAL